MSRHARYIDEVEPLPPPPPEPVQEENQDEQPAEELPETERPEVFDYEPINISKAKTREIPFNGSPVMISTDETTPGVLAMWYSTRKRIGYQWKLTMAWIDPITRTEINMVPKFWRANPRMGAFW